MMEDMKPNGKRMGKEHRTSCTSILDWHIDISIRHYLLASANLLYFLIRFGRRLLTSKMESVAYDFFMQK